MKNHRGKTYRCGPADHAAVQAGHHRDPAGEQPDGSVGPVLDHRARPVPACGPVRRVLPATDRARRRHGPAGAAASADPPVDAAPDQGAVAAELPPKQEQVVEVELHPRHQRIYQTHLQRERQKVLGLIEDLDSNRFTMLRSLTLLRRLSLDRGPARRGARRRAGGQDRGAARGSGRVRRRGTPGPGLQPVHHVPGRIRARLTEAGIAYAYLDGRTRNRDRVIAALPRPAEASVFLISLKAGGFGLNLTEADYCFVLDPWWNPATEAQAVDRTHRIGQTKTGDGLPAGRQGHHRGEGDGAEGPEIGAVRVHLRPRRPGRGDADRRGNQGSRRRLRQGSRPCPLFDMTRR